MTTYVKVTDITTTFTKVGEIEPTNYDTDTDYDNAVQYDGIDQTLYEKVADIAPDIVKVEDL